MYFGQLNFIILPIFEQKLLNIVVISAKLVMSYSATKKSSAQYFFLKKSLLPSKFIDKIRFQKSYTKKAIESIHLKSKYEKSNDVSNFTPNSQHSEVLTYDWCTINIHDDLMGKYCNLIKN